MLISDLAHSATVHTADDPFSITAEQRSQEISDLINDLGHGNFRIRVSAQQSLEKIGLPAYEQLRRALDHPNVQIARSAEYLLKSQNVIWWLETDSSEVRLRLEDYSSLDINNRITRLLDLGTLGTEDALLALCRIAKFESSEVCSRAAALSFLNKVYKLEKEIRQPLAESALLTIKGANRTSTMWIQSFCRQVVGLDPFDINVWKRYATELSESSKQMLVTPVEAIRTISPQREEQKLQVIRFYEWLISWIGSNQKRDVVLELARPSLKLVAPTQFSAREFSNWALSVDLPELVVELSNSPQTKPLFDKDFSDLVYLLAEAHRDLGDEATASQIAERARKIPIARIAGLGQLARGSNKEIEASQRSEQARELIDRGLFDWAEEELKAAVSLQSRMDWAVRYELAEFYRDGLQYAKAVETIQPIAESEPPDKSLPIAEYDHAGIVASYHWYLALQAIEQQKPAEAAAQLRLACENNQLSTNGNPDIVISLYRNLHDPQDKTLFRGYFKQMVERYRADVTEQEKLLALDQVQRNPRRLAESCNQLAWLLANCETNLDEALYLSQRSLDFNPDTDAYLDTYARCCFAAGRLEDAIKFQKKAIAASPHSRSMRNQLDEFTAALARQQEK
jgi:tetratricopeptide (TPR) repeat protein